MYAAPACQRRMRPVESEQDARLAALRDQPIERLDDRVAPGNEGVDLRTLDVRTGGGCDAGPRERSQLGQQRSVARLQIAGSGQSAREWRKARVKSIIQIFQSASIRRLPGLRSVSARSYVNTRTRDIWRSQSSRSGAESFRVRRSPSSIRRVHPPDE